MSAPVIEVSGLTKVYRLGSLGAGTLREELSGWLRRLRGQVAPNDGKDFCALRDVSFTVSPGEVVGVIGRNGAGKSTLLKILSRVTEPTSGRAVLRGRVGSLLEVGTGFHPDLSGRDNIFLNGAILGMKRAEIRAKFDEIVAFAEVDQFIDTPVKRYSSGMYVRLAFAVAAHLEPEILIVDEVLAVGDAQFQKKCLGKISDVAHSGRTVLFVSHNMQAVQSLTHRTLLLEAGALTKVGPSHEVVPAYLQTAATGGSEMTWPDQASAPGDAKAHAVAIRVVNLAGAPCTMVPIDQPVAIEFTYRVLTPGTKLNVSLSLFSSGDAYVLASPSVSDREWYQQPHPAGVFTSRCVIPANLLNHERYHVTALLVEAGSRIVTQLDKVVAFEAVDTGTGRGGYFGYWGGVVRPTLEWRTLRHTGAP